MNARFLLGKFEMKALFLLGKFKMKCYTKAIMAGPIYIERTIDGYLREWKSQGRRKPLLVRGVRQCGKTSAIRNLARSFETYIELNLEKQAELRSIFEGDIDCKKIIARLELEYSAKIQEGKALLFIDEIQECPRAISALRYFYEEMPALHVVAAGSLLEFVLNGRKRGESFDFPVGRVRSLYMYPFSFREFLMAKGEALLCRYLDTLEIGKQENMAHGKLTSLYKQFLIVGGMPEAVREYIESGSLFACQQVHRDILLNFKDDFAKYSADVPTDIIGRVFDYALHNVCCQTKSSSAVKGISSYYFDECVSLLSRAGLVIPVKASSCDCIPLGVGGKEVNKKLLFFDSGVYLTENKLDASGMLAAQAFDEMNKGAVVEMQTGLEIQKNASAYGETALYYWYQSGANAEVDYVYQKGAHIIPLEVKASGKGSMQSMRSYLKKFPDVPYGIRISMEDFGNYEAIRVYPVYAVSRIVE